MQRTVISGILALCIGVISGQSPLRINEIMTSNMSTLMVDHQYPDSWVEIVNDSELSIPIAGYLIGKKRNVSKAWRLPDSAIIPPHGYFLVYCDKEGTGVHTDFRLDAEGGSVYLFSPDSTLVESVEYPAQPATDVSYGKYTLFGTTGWGFMTSATPGSQNINKTSTHLMPEPEFSHNSEMIHPDNRHAVQLEISIPPAAPQGTKLLLTHNGREPELTDQWNGDKAVIDITGNSVIRAKLYHPDWLMRPSSARSFVYPTDDVHDVDVVSIITDPWGLNDETEGIFSNVTKNWRRPGVIHYFQASKDYEPVIDQVMEFRVQGGVSRTQPQQSLAVYAHRRYAPGDCFEAALWPAKPEIEATQSFVLRAGGNTWAYERINDQLAAELARNYLPTVDYMAYTPAIYFINGEYMGIVDVRERSNEDFVWANYGRLEDIDMIENNRELKSGSNATYEEFIDLSNSPEATWEKLSKFADMDGLLDQFALRAFGHDTDYPHNNIVCWRPSDGSAPWKWIMKDVDRFGIQILRSDTEKDFGSHIAWLRTLSQHERYMGPFVFFYNNKEASQKLIERMAVFSGDFLQPESGRELVDSLCQYIAPYMESTMQHYDPKGWANRVVYWDFTIRDMKENWWPQRQKAIYQTLAARFGLGKPIALTIEQPDSVTVMTFNNIALRRPKFNGMYFAGRSFALESEEYGQWTVTAQQTEGESDVTTYNSHRFVYSLPENATNVAISFRPMQAPEGYDKSGIEAIKLGNYISFSTFQGNIAEIRVFNIQGKMLMAKKFDSERVEMTLDPLPSVPVIIRVTTTTGETSTFKHIIR